MELETCIGFDRSLARFRSRLSDEQKQNFTSTSRKEVENSMTEIQDRIGPEKKLRTFSRIRKFLEGMEQIEELVKIFLNVSEVVAFVWIASTRIDSLDLLLGAYQDIGEALHGVGKYERLFKNYPDARDILDKYFYDVLEFHYSVLQVFSGPGWKKFFSYAWPTFKTRFRPILDSLKRHRDLLSDEKLSVIIEEVQESRKTTEGRLESLSSEIKEKLSELREHLREKDLEQQGSLKKLKDQLVTKLNPPDWEADQHDASKQRYAPSSGDWIFGDVRYKEWLQGTTQEHNVLYINGIPGSGKTTLTSRIIDQIRSESHTLTGAVAFFYFKNKTSDGSRRTITDMYRALLTQLLGQDDALIEYLHQKCAPANELDLHREEYLREMTKTCLLSQRQAWIILDGLDECDEVLENNRTESRQLVKWLIENILPDASTQGCHIRILISGQRDGHIDSLLHRHPGINLDGTPSHIRDIENYTNGRASLIRQRFSLDPSEEASIVDRVKASSKGMFLYAKVVLDNLLAQDSPAELEDELNQNNFPQRLDAAYERVAIRILDRPSASRSNSARKILSWVICAQRPFRWREIRIYVVIHG
ncbi:hypothetical protein F5Y04DRAFT_285493 [Hypomontagnella monticulosa]|nr:hypothetical protein F5Y04DRAFT_285493 [Hypomontagnella monticulosa]